MDLKKLVWEGVEWIDLSQDKDRWRDLVNTVMNFKMHGVSLLVEKILASQKDFAPRS
jgi:hypothetical protein